MRYRNANHVLPDELLKEVQKYASGEAIYIPKLQEKKKWICLQKSMDYQLIE